MMRFVDVQASSLMPGGFPVTVYGWACRPLLDRLPPGVGPARGEAERQVRETAIGIVARAGESEALRPRVRLRALPDAESLWRTWRAVRDEVARRMADVT